MGRDLINSDLAFFRVSDFVSSKMKDDGIGIGIEIEIESESEFELGLSNDLVEGKKLEMRTKKKKRKKERVFCVFVSGATSENEKEIALVKEIQQKVIEIWKRQSEKGMRRNEVIAKIVRKNDGDASYACASDVKVILFWFWILIWMYSRMMMTIHPLRDDDVACADWSDEKKVIAHLLMGKKNGAALVFCHLTHTYHCHPMREHPFWLFSLHFS